jgi:cellobiose dehydrogenase (acceptor)
MSRTVTNFEQPNPADWDYNFPKGWQSSDMAAAAGRVFSRIPGTDHPSLDGQLYLQTGYGVVSQGLANAGWTNVVANTVPSQKNRTYAHTPYMYSHGERGGPMATYLQTAMARSNFHMWLNTSVERIVRTAGHATGLEVIPTNNGGYNGTIRLTPTTGRVIVSAGAFGTAKLLFRSKLDSADRHFNLTQI